MIWPTVLRGFSDAYGSWKIICISRRSGRSWRCESCGDVAGRRSGSFPAVGSSSRSISRAVVDLPQPDSPTMPSVSPRRTVSDTSSTACTWALPRANTPCLTANRLVRCSSSTRLSELPFALTPPLFARSPPRSTLRSHGRWQASRWASSAGACERRTLRAHGLEAVRAARVERAAGRRREQRRRRALDRHERGEALGRSSASSRAGPRRTGAAAARRSRSPGRTP